MEMQKEPNFKNLENNIIDVIIEEQIKLGYRSETIRLYYPMESINSLLETDVTIDELKEVLVKFCQSVSDRFGNVEFSNKDKRFCFVIPPSGVTYVHEKVEDRIFLREFIEKITEHGCTIETILELFYRHSNHVVFEKIKDGEFDYLIYFQEGQPDSYRYCIKFEDCHAIYHRFTKADYETIL